MPLENPKAGAVLLAPLPAPKEAAAAAAAAAEAAALVAARAAGSCTFSSQGCFRSLVALGRSRGTRLKH